MAESIAAHRRSALDGLSLPSKDGVAVVRDAGAAVRFIYRGTPAVLSEPLGITPPAAPMRSETRNGRTALWLGPDEWLLLASSADQATLHARLVDALRDQPSSLVDIGHRQIGLVIAGPRADDLLNAGCPLDLRGDAFPVGMCTRTILAKAEIVLWRTADDAFHLEVARSLAPYVVEFLREATFGVG